jgi:hypothetical protein
VIPAFSSFEGQQLVLRRTLATFVVRAKISTDLVKLLA